MDEYEKAKRQAAALAAYRMYTCHEVELRLIRKKIDKDVAERIVGEFAEAGILDDRSYAEAYKEDAVRLGYKGMYRIRQELYAKGVAKSIIDSVCQNSEEDTYTALCEYVEARRLCEGITTRRDLEKLKAKLARRGYSPSEIRRCLDNYTFELEYNDR